MRSIIGRGGWGRWVWVWVIWNGGLRVGVVWGLVFGVRGAGAGGEVYGHEHGHGLGRVAR
ncbi:hypothetical protein K439DRAFT_821851 [Ramaria rubella]|nr:hypothetical protein K439DRAFT_821851 [Ramaria rubella]